MSQALSEESLENDANPSEEHEETPVTSLPMNGVEYQELLLEMRRSIIPDADDEPFTFALSLLHAADIVKNQLDAQVFRPMGTSNAHRRVLNALMVLGSMNPTQIASLSRVRPPSVSSVLNTLEKLGFIVRTKPEGRDRRTVIVSITDAGREAVVKQITASHELESYWASKLTARQRHSLISNLQRLMLALEEDEAREATRD